MTDTEWSRIPVTLPTPWYQYNGQGWIETDTPMSDNERDTHFQGFARLLWEEMLSQTQGYYIDVMAGHIPLHHPEDEEHALYIDIIARRAYDLVRYAYHFVDNIEEPLAWNEILAILPDLTKWPD